MPRRLKRMSASDILDYVPAEPDMRNARYVQFWDSRNVGTDDHPILKTLSVTSEPDQKPRRHRQTIRPKNLNYKGPLYKCPAILVDCDCMRYLFKWEYALAYHGAANIFRCNGAPPVEMNPKMIPGACKHIMIMLSAIRKVRI